MLAWNAWEHTTDMPQHHGGAVLLCVAVCGVVWCSVVCVRCSGVCCFGVDVLLCVVCVWCSGVCCFGVDVLWCVWCGVCGALVCGVDVLLRVVCVWCSGVCCCAVDVLLCVVCLCVVLWRVLFWC